MKEVPCCDTQLYELKLDKENEYGIMLPVAKLYCHICGTPIKD